MNALNTTPNPFIVFPVFQTLSWVFQDSEVYVEITKAVFVKLKADADLCRARLVCKAWKQLIEASGLWKRFFSQKARVPWETLPPEMGIRIFSYLSIQSLGISQKVCKSWYEMGAQSSLWKALLEKTFCNLSAIPEKLKIHPKNFLATQFTVKVNRAQVSNLLPPPWEEGHTENIQSAFFPNGQLLIISSNNECLVSLYDAKTKKHIRNFNLSEGESHFFSPDYLRRITLKDGSFQLSDTQTGELLGDLIVANVFSSNNPRVIIREDGSIELARVQIENLKMGKHKFSPNNQRLIVNDADFVYLLDAQTGQLICTLKRPEYISLFSFSPDSQKFAMSKGPDSFGVWDANTGKCLGSWNGRGASWIAFSPDGQRLIAYGRGLIHLFNVNTGECLHTSEADINIRAPFSPDSQRLIIRNQEGFIHLVDVQTGQTIQNDFTENERHNYLSFSSDSRWLITSTPLKEGGANLAIAYHVWNAQTGEKVRTFAEQKIDLFNLEILSPNNDRLVVTTYSSFSLWDIHAGTCLARLEAFFTPFIRFSPDSERLVIENFESIYLLDAQTGKIIQKWKSNILYSFFTPDSQFLAFESPANLEFFDAQTGEFLCKIEKQEETTDFHLASFSPNGRQILLGTDVIDLYSVKEDDFQDQLSTMLVSEEEIDILIEQPILPESRKGKSRSEQDQESGNPPSSTTNSSSPPPKKRRKKEE